MDLCVLRVLNLLMGLKRKQGKIRKGQQATKYPVKYETLGILPVHFSGAVVAKYPAQTLTT